MAFTATATPNVLQDPGALFWAPAGSAVPSHTVAGSVFTDSWTAPWVPLGATEDGTELTYEIKVEAIMAAEFFDAIKYATTERSGSFAFALEDYTLTKLKYAMNGATQTVVSGTGATQLNKLTPPIPGAETRAMIGWESLDHTMRAVAYQCINSGSIKTSFKKAPKIATIACQFNFEIPLGSTTPIDFWSAGTARV